MMQIDPVNMGMNEPVVPMGMAVRRFAFPACMLMLMVVIVHMQVLVLQGLVDMPQLTLVLNRQPPPRKQRRQQSTHGEYRESDEQTEAAAEAPVEAEQAAESAAEESDNSAEKE